jgi:flagellin-like hook-associated protein FlgL
VVYAYGSSAAPTYASWDAANQTMTVHLQTNGKEPPSASSEATASAVAAAVNAASTAYGAQLAATAAGTGQVELSRGTGGLAYNTIISFNHGTTVSVDGTNVTVYLARGDYPDDQIVATAQDVADAINNDPIAGSMLKAGATGVGAFGTAEIQSSYQSMTVTDPYTLAQVLAEVPGTHNDLVYSVLNEPGAAIGAAGNQYSVVYQWPDPPAVTASTTARYDSATSTIIVTLGTSASVFLDEYARLYATPSLSTYHDAAESMRLARLAANTGTAASVASAVNALSSAENLHIGAKNAEGDSGLGLVTAGGPFQFQEGYDQPALFRVSQDGGLTWGPPTAISPSEFQTGGLYYNSQLGHASLTTNLPGGANDLVFTANYMGTWGDDVRVEYRAPSGANPSEAKVEVGPQPWNICVTLGTDAAGRVNTTAQQVMDLVNNHPEAGQLVTASLANYHEGGGGVVTVMDCVNLSTGEPYEIDGRTRITPLGYATATVAFDYNPPDQASPDLIFQALTHGSSGNAIGVRYTVSADAAVYGQGALYQDQVTISYETDELGRQIAVVHLATTSLPSCPDPENEREAYDQFQKLYPTYSCTSSRAVLSTAGDVLEALVAKNLAEPDTALVWASMEWKDEGWDSTAKVGPTGSTVWLTGGDDSLKASDYGVALKFVPDGSSLQVGDIFEVDVGWYNGDSGNLDIESMSGYRTTTNVAGDALLGANGADDNVLDTISRLSWALKHDDSELVAAELPKLKAAIEKITTMETNLGTKIIRNEFVLNNLELNKYAAETILSETEDADFTKLITDLKNAQTVYEAVLGTTGLTTKLTLLNYL